ncbi:N-formylglutamate amidohydrolase [Sphingomonas sp. BIUV-7]|uniref:N-formylglutamate amidohydrolase n=1 Tax=Sphingomonas natans TaxID=3063330 RepID=A0ABT8Y602_9SPHN|nr:N-formylglutamate amidohydrolase [Sphingomonas sp. BIUV-7]MDO6413750.1 N-formylglutamate amidohydrolase [Sphingomonas sp. BIUV-7]
MTLSQPPAPPPFLRLGPASAQTPLVIAVPHAGRHYPSAIGEARAVGWRTLEDLEDRYADRLVSPAVEAGAVAIVATHGRAWIDLNRGEADAGHPDAAAASPRARAGLGLVPSRIAGRPLWRRFPDEAEIGARIAALHTPYHRAIADALAAARQRHGFALLVDCHSMPSLGRPGRMAARIVIGDRHGASAGLNVSEAAVGAGLRHGLPTTRNAPYAGAFTIEHHGRPSEGVHAIQVEIDRSLYLKTGLREPSDRLAGIAAIFTELCWDAVDSLAGITQAKAAE